jgi:hypothetical protein
VKAEREAKRKENKKKQKEEDDKVNRVISY